MRRRLFLFVGLLVCFGCQRSSDYPNRPLQLICPWAVGGGTDAVSRHIAHLLEAKLGQPVNVINATGGSGVTGHGRSARAKPDGYSLAMMTVEINMLHWRGFTDLTYRDFEPLVLLNRDAAAVFVGKDAPWRSLSDLAKDAAAAQPKLTASGTAKGGIWHIALIGGIKAMGLESDSIIWVPSKGAGPSLQELASGGINLVCCSLPEAQSLMDADKIRCLGVMADERLEAYPEVPTFKEQDCDWSMGGWRGLALPPGVPAEIADQLRTTLTEIVKSKEFIDFMDARGFDARCETGAEFLTSLETTDESLGVLMREQFANVEAEQFGPMFFPTGIALALVAVTSLLTAGHLKQARVNQPENSFTLLSGRTVTAIAEPVVIVVLFVVAAEPLGFIVAGWLLLTYLLFRLGNKTTVVLGVPTVLIPAIYEIFGNQFLVPLPRGVLGW